MERVAVSKLSEKIKSYQDQNFTGSLLASGSYDGAKTDIYYHMVNGVISSIEIIGYEK